MKFRLYLEVYLSTILETTITCSKVRLARNESSGFIQAIKNFVRMYSKTRGNPSFKLIKIYQQTQEATFLNSSLPQLLILWTAAYR